MLELHQKNTYTYMYIYIYMKNWCFKFRKYKNRKGWIWFEVNELE